MPSGAPGSLSRPASLTISSWAALSSLASAFSTSPALAWARRAAAPCTKSDALVVEPRQPPDQRHQGLGTQLLKQLRQLLLGGVHRRLVQRLDQLRERLPLGQPGWHSLECLPVLRDQLAGSL